MEDKKGAAVRQSLSKVRLEGGETECHQLNTSRSLEPPAGHGLQCQAKLRHKPCQQHRQRGEEQQPGRAAAGGRNAAPAARAQRGSAGQRCEQPRRQCQPAARSLWQAPQPLACGIGQHRGGCCRRRPLLHPCLAHRWRGRHARHPRQLRQPHSHPRQRPGALADSMRARAAESEKLKDELSSVKQSKGVLIRQNIMLTQEVQELQSKVEEAEKKGQVLQTHFSVADASKEATRRVSLACWSQVAERRQPSSRVQRPWLPVWEGCQGGPMESWLGEWAALWAAADLLASAVQAVTFPALPDVLRPPRVRPPTACLQTLTDVTMQSAAAAAERDHLKAVVQGQAGQLQELQGQLHTREQALQASVAGIAAAVMGNRLAAAPPPPPNLSCICMSVLGRGVEGVRD